MHNSFILTSQQNNSVQSCSYFNWDNFSYLYWDCNGTCCSYLDNYYECCQNQSITATTTRSLYQTCSYYNGLNHQYWNCYGLCCSYSDNNYGCCQNQFQPTLNSAKQLSITLSFTFWILFFIIL